MPNPYASPATDMLGCTGRPAPSGTPRLLLSGLCSCLFVLFWLGLHGPAPFLSSSPCAPRARPVLR